MSNNTHKHKPSPAQPSQQGMGMGNGSYTWVLSFVPILILIILLSITLSIYGSDALTGPSQICLLIATAVCASIGMGCMGVKWKTIEETIQNNIRETSVSICILLIIGALSGAWMMSGIVPTMIFYGVKIILPEVFLVLACAISAAVSLMTGSSWTTVATIGLALLGIGRALGYEDGWIAGAIISGAYFGDKVSPLSDTTVLASSISRVNLFAHIRYMMRTTIPTITITLVIFFFVGLMHSTNGDVGGADIPAVLETKFHISLWLMLIPVATGVMIYKKVPSLIVLFLSSLIALITAVVCQPHILAEIVGSTDLSARTMFAGCMQVACQSSSVSMDHALLDELVSTSGMAGMLNTVWLILCAMCFGAAMTATGMLRTFLKAIFSRLARTRFGLVLSTSLNSIFMNLATGDQYISIILSASMFQEEYEKQGYEGRLLSRTCEDTATVTSVLIPWNTCGMTQATILGVATITYLPYCFFNYLSPLMTLLFAAMGWGIKRRR